MRIHGDDEMNSGHLQLHGAQKPTLHYLMICSIGQEVDSFIGGTHSNFIGDWIFSSVLGILGSMCDAKSPKNWSIGAPEIPKNLEDANSDSCVRYSSLLKDMAAGLLMFN